jgi:hypothetical protein
MAYPEVLRPPLLPALPTPAKSILEKQLIERDGTLISLKRMKCNCSEDFMICEV